MSILQHVNLGDYPGWSKGYVLLSEALERNRGNSMEIVKLLLQYGAKVNSKTNALWGNSDTSLYHAVRTKNVETVEMLLNHGAIVNSRNTSKYEGMLLHISIENGSQEIVQLLLSRGADVESTAYIGYRPLHLAAKAHNHNVKIIQLLLNYGAEVNSVSQFLNSGYYFTALYLASSDKTTDAVKLLLQHGADVNYVSTDICKNEKRSTLVIQNAVECGSDGIVELLLQYGAIVNSTENSSSELLHVAVRRGSEKMVQLLLDNNEEIEGKDEKGLTVFHKAVKEGKLGIVKLLVGKDYYADIDIENEKKETSLDLAKGYHSKDVLKLLLKYGSKYRLNSNDTNWYYNSKFIMEHAIKMQAANLNDVKVKVPPHMNHFCKKREIKVATFTRNENIMKIINTKLYKEMFPLYRSMLQIRINKGKTRNELMEKGATCLASLLENLELKIPDLVIQEIFSFLNNRDLRNLIYTSPIEFEEISSDIISKHSMLEQPFGP
ncbi:ankyrin-3-like [Belonocnema kinseyi]|uniref:ankyrin-3-like n=1 Tax=Belonocnema kinseyi TaxID=2817044 RepID=UPI00143DC4B5|nr:ankyrin-3-like [Belonocnema kinseyi]